jgi:hypothetical protein
LNRYKFKHGSGSKEESEAVVRRVLFTPTRKRARTWAN